MEPPDLVPSCQRPHPCHRGCDIPTTNGSRRRIDALLHTRRWWAPALVLLTLTMASASRGAEGHAFEVVAPNRVPFNYPDPPHEGAPGFFTIAEGGKARCEIVYEARSRTAADLLKAYLELSTGASIEVVQDGKQISSGLAAIHVGDTVVARKVDLKIPQSIYGGGAVENVNGFLVRTLDAQTLVIRGVTTRATTLGVVSFLKRYVGVRHYWAGNPGDIGDVVPPHPALTLPEIEWRDWPYFLSRQASGLNTSAPAPAGPYAKVSTLDFYRLNYTIPSNESYYLWIRADVFGQSHPEYFPLFQGKRFIPKVDEKGVTAGGGWQPCVSNPELPQVVADELIAYFDKNPDAAAINLAVNDGNGDCECDQCRAMDAPHADMANRVGLCDRYIKFNNKVCELVARKYPHKIVAFIAYGSTRLPPTTVKPHPMLMPVVTIGRNFFDQWDGWLQQGTGQMGFYLYHDDQAFFIMPKMDVHQSARRILYAVASGRARHFYQEMYPLWPIDAMVPYIETELLWDPRLDVDAMLGEYYTKFFGPAAGPMKGFYDTLEEGYNRYLDQEGLPHWYGKDRSSLSEGRLQEHYKVLTIDEVTRAQAFLQQAAAAVAPGSREAQRIDVVDKTFGFIALGVRQYATMMALKSARVNSEDTAAAVVAQAREVVALAHAESDYKQDVMLKAPANVYASFKSSSGESRNVYFTEVQPGRVNPLVMLAVSEGFDAANGWLREKLGSEAAAAWWDRQRNSGADPMLGEALAIARAKSSGAVLANMIKDPGYEDRGAGKWPRPVQAPPNDGTESPLGVFTWHRTGTPVNVSLSADEAHTGKYSVCMTECGVAMVSESITCPGSGRYHFEVWLKHNEPEASYKFRVWPAGPDGKTPPTEIDVPIKPGEWQKIALDFAAPAGTKAISLMVLANGQSPGAKLWIDDFFAGKYPEQ